MLRTTSAEYVRFSGGLVAGNFLLVTMVKAAKSKGATHKRNASLPTWSGLGCQHLSSYGHFVKTIWKQHASHFKFVFGLNSFANSTLSNSESLANDFIVNSWINWNRSLRNFSLPKLVSIFSQSIQSQQWRGPSPWAELFSRCWALSTCCNAFRTVAVTLLTSLPPLPPFSSRCL